MKNKVFIALFLFVIFFTLTISPCMALEVSPSNNVTSTSTNANNLINYANSYSNFVYSDYVVLQSGDNEYYIVWGKDFTVNNSVVTADKVEFIRYYRTGTMNNSYIYDYGTSDNFRLTLNDYVVTSNLNIGMTSSIFDTYRTNYYTVCCLILGVSLLFSIALTNFRRSH